MSIADDVSVALFIADYGVADASQKLNILGGAWQICGLNAATGLTPPQTVVTILEVPAKYRGEQFALSLTLLNEAGDPVEVPGPTGESQALRVQQLAKVDPPMAPGVHIPPHVPSRVQTILNLANGLPLAPNNLYRWELEVDGNRKPHWRVSFFVVGPPPPPVIG